MYIYCYTNKINKNCYVGQTNNLERRKREHYSNSYNLNNPSTDLLLHKAIRKYGIDNFEIVVLEEVDDKDVDNREQYWIEEKRSYAPLGYGGYNLTEGGVQYKKVSKISLEVALQIIEEIKQGISYNSISERYNICLSYISNINQGICFRQNNETYPLYRYVKSDEEYETLIDLLLNSDLTFKEIATSLNIGESTVKKINYGKLKPNLYPSYPIRKETPQQKKAKRVQELLLLGVSDSEILQEVDVSKETIRRINLGITNNNINFIYPLR